MYIIAFLPATIWHWFLPDAQGAQSGALVWPPADSPRWGGRPYSAAASGSPLPSESALPSPVCGGGRMRNPSHGISVPLSYTQA